MTKHFLLFYDYAADVLERRPQFRGAHLEYAWAAVERGELILGGALADPVDGGVLIFAGADKTVAEEISTLVARLNNRWDSRDALRRFADDLDSPDADAVIAALILASNRGANGASVTLQALAIAIHVIRLAIRFRTRVILTNYSPADRFLPIPQR